MTLLLLGRRDAGQAAEFDDSVQRSGIRTNQTAVAGGAVADQSDTKVCIFHSRWADVVFPRSRQVIAAFGITLALAAGAYYCATLHRTMARSDCDKRED